MMSKRKIFSGALLSAAVLLGMMVSQPSSIKAEISENVGIETQQVSEPAPIFGQGDLVQETNHTNLFKRSVSVEASPGDKANEVKWTVTFDATHWNLQYDKGGYYFIVPEGMKLTKLVGSQEGNLLDKFPEDVEAANNDSYSPYRHFKKGVSSYYYDRDFDSQWGWSVGRIGGAEVNEWKSRNAFSDIYYIDSPRHGGRVTYELTAEVVDDTKTSFPLVAVMKNFYAKTSYFGEVASLAGREVTVETR